MDTTTDKGFPEKVPVIELNRADEKVQYLPHCGLYHPMKPGKIRVMFDCSAEYRAIWLNDALLQSPDKMNNLLRFLMRLCEEKDAVIGDLECMYCQVQ